VQILFVFWSCFLIIGVVFVVEFEVTTTTTILITAGGAMVLLLLFLILFS
jgi:hypothetical protein